jgi:nitrogen-specific signal transduction histidine kinase
MLRLFISITKFVFLSFTMKQFQSKYLRWILVLSSLLIVTLILWNTWQFFQKIKVEERNKMEIWAAAQNRFANADLNADTSLELKIITKFNKTPMLSIDEKTGELYDSNNIDSTLVNDKTKRLKLIERMRKKNTPIKIFDTVVLYYGDSPLLEKIKYYPLMLLLLLALFSGAVYFFLRSSRISDQNKLWVGMAKETAHQIGTPLSSLMGWAALLRTEQVDQDYVNEIENDVLRLKNISERFSKIGSLPELTNKNIISETQEAIKYLQARSPKKVNFDFISMEEQINLPLNVQLYSWVIENLIKNALDALKGKGNITIEIINLEKQVKIQITDTGKGIPHSEFKAIFKPGYTTKKRGWGLGLSLAKRIIEDYHKGKIFVKKSELNKGTTFCVILKKN